MKLDNLTIALQKKDGRIIYTEAQNPLNKIFRDIIITVIFVLIAVVAFGKQNKFSSLQQVTDKQVLIETNTGEQILFNAFSDEVVGVEYINNRKVGLLSEGDNSLKEMNGSIYVEELDELLQITTVNPDGLIVKIDRKTLEIQFIEKGTNNLIHSEIPFAKGNGDNTREFFIEHYSYLTWAKTSKSEESVGIENLL